MIKYLSISICLFNKAYNKYIKSIYYKFQLGYCGKNVMVKKPNAYTSLSRMYMFDNTNIFEGFNFISYTGKFIMKKNSSAAQGLTIITGNHGRQIGSFFILLVKERLLEIEKDIIVEEDVYIGANVTILSGVTIGRGSNIGAGSVLRFNIPPYSIVIGNPAKIIGFVMTPDEIIEHEKVLYTKEERLKIEVLKDNYNKYFISQMRNIKTYININV